MDSMRTKYAGRRINGRMDDPQATYEFPSHFNSSYKGGFKDGMFQGEGKLYFPELGMIYSGKFDKGVSTEGALEFTDGLLCDDPWSYCDGNQNRMFKSEMEKGMKPAGRSQLTNQDPPRSIPDGMYDCSDGFYDPQKRTILDYDLAFLRNAGNKVYRPNAKMAAKKYSSSYYYYHCYVTKNALKSQSEWYLQIQIANKVNFSLFL
ncbi:PREDICTED: MORN repeat-containing protein 5-like [Acropora digitifera]|uniref:MORN repeat-containing protein 5-like n=1 Tax=Acropora digitifera TaxID=70779 RepID=UPI00077B2696|nr:PREDICTED: MORN repeat-containing protein 5-like [Acropora digitifera]